MKVKLDENLPSDLVALLKLHGHDVHTVPEESLAGHPDAAILDAILREDRMLLTQDLDFSDLRRFRPGTHPGIVLIRIREPSRRRLVDRLRQVLEAESIDTWAGCFVIVTDWKLRIKRPSGDDATGG